MHKKEITQNRVAASTIIVWTKHGNIFHVCWWKVNRMIVIKLMQRDKRLVVHF